tara:strand:+ start:97890 stop:98495 length:606 start_codon:yes stop_codon:yes gene_type:complete
LKEKDGNVYQLRFLKKYNDILLTGIRIEKEIMHNLLNVILSVLIIFSSLFLTKSAFADSSAYEIELFCQDINVLIQRVHVVSANIANANTTRTLEGGPYKRQIINICEKGHCKVTESSAAPILKYEPSHPDADKNGYVAYPNIDVHREMSDLVKIQRAYELVVKHAPIKSIDLLVGTKLEHCFEDYTYFKDGYDFKKYLGR